MGSGKTTVGQLLATDLHIPFIDLDECIELLEEMSITEIFNQHGEAYFRKLEYELLNQIMNSEAEFVIATGGGTPCFFNQIEILNERCITIYMECKPSVLEKRLAESSQTRPILSTLPGGIQQHLNERVPIYKRAQIIVNGELPAQELSRYIKSKLQ